MEKLFRKVRRNVRKKFRNTAAETIPTESSQFLSLCQNMTYPKYEKTVLDSADIPAVFAKYRKLFKKME